MSSTATEWSSPTARRRAACVAATLDERVAALARCPAADREPGPEATKRLRTWQRLVAPGDRESFRRRLGWDGLDEEEAARALDVTVYRDDVPLPDWVELVASVVAECDRLLEAMRSGRGLAELEPIRDRKGEPPFVELWLPFLRDARRRLRRRAPSLQEGFTERARTDLEMRLLRDLAGCGAAAMEARFRDRLPADQTPSADSDLHYRRFVTDMLDGGLGDLLGELPVLARSLARMSATWVDATAELVERLARDRDDIAARFGGRAGRVASISGLSDRHRDGRRIAIVEFETGLRVVYKPRSVGMDAAYDALLGWLAAEGLDPMPPRLRVLERDGYGWIQEVVGGRLESPEEAERYFAAAGALVCLAYVLRGRDLHFENVLATDEGPVIVDLEMLLQPETVDERSRPSHGGGRAVADSCLGSGIVSMLRTDESGEIRDQGGLRSTGVAVSQTPRREWRGLRSDAIRAERHHEVRFETRNRPLLDGEPQSPEDWSEAVLAGFEAAYRSLWSGRAALLAEDGPLGRFRDQSVRLLFRPSNQYGALLHVLSTPRYQRSGALRSCAIDSLNRVFAGQQERPVLWPLVALERDALENLDVPLFRVSASDNRVNGVHELPGYLLRSGLEAVRERVAGLDSDDLQNQLELLGWVLEQARTRITGAVDGKEEEGSPPPDPVDVAEGIAEELVARARSRPDGRPWWPVPRLARQGPRHPLSELALYEGSLGMAVLFAALARVRGGRWRQLALEVVEEARDRLDAGIPGEWLARPGGAGAATGLGSLLHGTALVSRLVRSPELLEPALEAGRGLRAATLPPGDRGGNDVVGGRAGLILGLLSLHAVTGDGELLAPARELGAQLREAAEPVGPGQVAWPDERGTYPAGFGHGSAGIAYALCRLAAATGDETLLELVRGAYRHERNLYEASRGNWRVARPDGVTPEGGVAWMVGWCHGAPGTALARVLTDTELGEAEWLREAEVGLQTTLRRGRTGSDHLCCGTLGRSDVLLTAGRRMGKEELARAARDLAGEVITAARRRGFFALPSSPFGRQTFAPGFFQGLSGIGYQMLRTAEPGRFPSVLGYEAPANDKE